jgi:hypothetical protein
MKAKKKLQVFCTDCKTRLAESIFPPALSRRLRGRDRRGNLKPQKYVCYECSVIQAFGGR